MSLTNNKLKSSLAVLTLFVWIVVFVQLWKANQTLNNENGNLPMAKSQAGFDLQLLKSKPISLDTNMRDPFESYLYAAAPKPVIKENKSKPKVLKKIVTPPTATLAGFMGGSNPIAILKQGNETQLLKVGEEAWGLKVKKISKSLVLVEKEGKEFEIRP